MRQNVGESRHMGVHSVSLGDRLNGFGCDSYDQRKQRFGNGYGNLVHTDAPFLLRFGQKKSRMDVLSIQLIKMIYSYRMGTFRLKEEFV